MNQLQVRLFILFVPHRDVVRGVGGTPVHLCLDCESLDHSRDAFDERRCHLFSFIFAAFLPDLLVLTTYYWFSFGANEDDATAKALSTCEHVNPTAHRSFGCKGFDYWDVWTAEVAGLGNPLRNVVLRLGVTAKPATLSHRMPSPTVDVTHSTKVEEGFRTMASPRLRQRPSGGVFFW
ncbi:hypothetical protein DFH09DRAFT_1097092 [Mycena vulgaris]|nr:hypothetical protein DFH09DRAFT_1097092 [Mycena vulgaris]